VGQVVVDDYELEVRPKRSWDFASVLERSEIFINPIGAREVLLIPTHVLAEAVEYQEVRRQDFAITSCRDEDR
jgi:hypothetical protein